MLLETGGMLWLCEVLWNSFIFSMTSRSGAHALSAIRDIPGPARRKGGDVCGWYRGAIRHNRHARVA